MKILFAFKIFGLLICLVGVISVMHRLSPGHIDKFFRTLGADPGAAQPIAPGLSGSSGPSPTRPSSPGHPSSATDPSSPTPSTAPSSTTSSPSSSPGFPTEMPSESSESSSYRLCETRIHSLRWKDGFRIEESKEDMKMKWLAYGTEAREPRELSYLEVEKWLSQNCSITVGTSAAAAAGLEFAPFVTIQFVNQNLKTVYRAGSNLFQIDGQVLRSSQLEHALENLRNF